MWNYDRRVVAALMVFLIGTACERYLPSPCLRYAEITQFVLSRGGRQPRQNPPAYIRFFSTIPTTGQRHEAWRTRADSDWTNLGDEHSFDNINHNRGVVGLNPPLSVPCR